MRVNEHLEGKRKKYVDQDAGRSNNKNKRVASDLRMRDWPIIIAKLFKTPCLSLDPYLTGDLHGPYNLCPFQI